MLTDMPAKLYMPVSAVYVITLSMHMIIIIAVMTSDADSSMVGHFSTT